MIKRYRFRFIRGIGLFILLIFTIPVSTGFAIDASTPKNVLASYPTDPTTNITWSAGTSGVADIQTAFNNARVAENNQLGTSIPLISLPSQVEWDSMDDGQKALWLINRERIDRGIMPLHSLEANVAGVAQYYSDYLLANNTWGHDADGRSPWDRLNENPAIGGCHDFLSISENLAVFVTSGASISMPIERSVYMWMYEDCCSWGHRHAILWYPYDDNSGLVGYEGFLGIGRASGGPYKGPFSQTWPQAEIIVMNVFDPCSSWNYSYPEVNSITRISDNPNYTSQISYRVVFSEEVHGVDKADFNLTTTGVTGASVFTVSGSGTTYTVTVSTGSGDGTIKLNLIDNDSIKDTANYPLGGPGIENGNFTRGEVYQIVFKTWYGGVSIISDHNLVSVGRPEINSQVMTYNGFNDGSTTIFVPMLFKDAFGGSYDAALYVQNLQTTNAANITIKYYDTNGNLTCTVNDTIARLSSKGYWLPSMACLGNSWVGAAVITSDQNIVAVGRPHIGAQITTYNGFASGSSSMYVPMLFKDAFGGSYDAALYVQNLQTTNAANITIKYYDTNGNLTCTVNDTIARLSSKGYWLPSMACLGNSWVGAAVITSDQNIVAVGRPHIGAQITTYNGFASGSSSMYVPMLFKDALGGSYDSALYIQNVHPSNTAMISLKFYDSSGNLTCTINDTISRLSSKGYWLPSLACLGSSWQGSARVESDQSVIAVGRPHVGTEIMTYNGTSNGSQLSNIPMLFRNAFGGSYDASVFLMNTDTNATANLTMSFYDTTGNLNCTKADTIPPRGTISFFLPDLVCDP